ncbi:phage integrase central domain-containing protein [Microvirga sp.]|uniref:phage integrase central domain-containing protein n=1 Tax=Microvirga sp. TaxID=1873136 RepID=UPI00391B7C41
MADEVIASLELGWRNPKHRDQWRMTLQTRCSSIRSAPFDQVTTDHVLEVLKPLWSYHRVPLWHVLCASIATSRGRQYPHPPRRRVQKPIYATSFAHRPRRVG